MILNMIPGYKNHWERISKKEISEKLTFKASWEDDSGIDFGWTLDVFVMSFQWLSIDTLFEAI